MSHLHNVYDTDFHFFINPTNREIVNRTGKKILVQRDCASEVFSFGTHRYIDGHDMTLCDKVEVHYINVDSVTKEKYSGIYKVTDFKTSSEDENIAVGSWKLSGNATQFVGSLSFALRFACTNGDVIEYNWSTLPYSKITVAETIDNAEEVAEQNSDILEAWYQELVMAGTMGVNIVVDARNNALTAIENARTEAVNEVKEYTNQTAKNATFAEEKAEAAEESAKNAENSAQTASDKAEEAVRAIDTVILERVQALTAIETAEINSLYEIEATKKAAINAVETVQNNAVDTVNNTKEQAVSDVDNAKNTAINEVNTLKETSVEAVETIKNNSVKEVNSVKETAVKAVTDQEETSISGVQSATDKAKAEALEEINLEMNRYPFAPLILSEKSGDIITVNDSAKQPLQNLRLFGKSKQFSTTGAQLMKLRVGDGVKHLCTFNDDDSVTITNTSGNAVMGPLCDLTGEIPAGTYTIKNISGAALYVVINDPNNYNLNMGVGGSKTFEYDGTSFLRIVYADNNTSTPTTYKAMLNAGNTALDYEPYTGGNASPSPDYPQDVESAEKDGDVEINVFGKNLIDFIYTGLIFGNGAHELTNVVNALPIGKYQITLNYKLTSITDSTTTEENIYGYMIHVNGRPLKQVNPKWGTTTIGTVKTLLVELDITEERKGNMIFYLYGCGTFSKGPTGTADIYDVQVERGDAPTEYEPCVKQSLIYSAPNGLRGIPVSSGGNYTDENGQQWICDEVDFAKGTYIQRIGVYEFTGNESSANLKESNTAHNIGHRIVFTNVFVRPTVNDSITEVYSNAFQPTNANFAYTTYAENCIATDSYGVINFYTPMTLDEFRAYLAEQYSNGTPVKVYYVMKNEVETPLTTEEINAFKALYMNKPNTTILSGENMGMSVEYSADTKIYIDNKFAELQNAILSAGANV